MSDKDDWSESELLDPKYYELETLRKYQKEFHILSESKASRKSFEIKNHSTQYAKFLRKWFGKV